MLSGYFNKPIQCGLNFLFWNLKNFLLFLHDQLAPLHKKENCSINERVVIFLLLHDRKVWRILRADNYFFHMVGTDIIVILDHSSPLSLHQVVTPISLLDTQINNSNSY